MLIRGPGEMVEWYIDLCMHSRDRYFLLYLIIYYSNLFVSMMYFWTFSNIDELMSSDCKASPNSRRLSVKLWCCERLVDSSIRWLFYLLYKNGMLRVLIRIASMRWFLWVHTTYNFLIKQEKCLKYLLILSCQKNFIRTQKRDIITRGKRAIGVRVIEVLLYISGIRIKN